MPREMKQATISDIDIAMSGLLLCEKIMDMTFPAEGKCASNCAVCFCVTQNRWTHTQRPVSVNTSLIVSVWKARTKKLCLPLV